MKLLMHEFFFLELRSNSQKGFFFWKQFAERSSFEVDWLPRTYLKAGYATLPFNCKRVIETLWLCGVIIKLSFTQCAAETSYSRFSLSLEADSADRPKKTRSPKNAITIRMTAPATIIKSNQLQWYSLLRKRNGKDKGSRTKGNRTLFWKRKD